MMSKKDKKSIGIHIQGLLNAIIRIHDSIVPVDEKLALTNILMKSLMNKEIPISYVPGSVLNPSETLTSMFSWETLTEKYAKTETHRELLLFIFSKVFHTLEMYESAPLNVYGGHKELRMSEYPREEFKEEPFGVMKSKGSDANEWEEEKEETLAFQIGVSDMVLAVTPDSMKAKENRAEEEEIKYKPISSMSEEEGKA